MKQGRSVSALELIHLTKLVYLAGIRSSKASNKVQY